MNYRHSYHAGNFADVFKHIVLVQLLRALARKDKAFAYLETHAGAGRYDLQSPEAQKSGESLDGVGRVWQGVAGADIEGYLSAVRVLNPDATLRYYPGSPRIARSLLRPPDRMRLAEQLPEAYTALKAEFDRDKQVEVVCGDGYALLRAWLPPPERRGLLLLDPAYDDNGEWDRLQAALQLVAERWQQGTCAIWYPLKAVSLLPRFKAAVRAAGLRRLLVAELGVWPADTPFRLNGCGMLIYNPPWQLDTELRAVIGPLAQSLRQGSGGQSTVEWLVPE